MPKAVCERRYESDGQGKLWYSTPHPYPTFCHWLMHSLAVHLASWFIINCTGNG